MVTPDAMRAQLRAQRARARAAGQPGGNFLTEQEEDEIIDQMQRQTRLMELDSSNSNHSWTDTAYQSESSEDHIGRIGSGSDGFGNSIDRNVASYHSGRTAGSSSSASRQNDRLDSLAQSLGELKGINHSSSSGSLFSGRSSERDYAYLRSLDSKKTGAVAPIAEETEDEADERSQNTSQTGQALSQNADAEGLEESDDVAMPGGFGDSEPSSKRDSKRDTRALLQRLGNGVDTDSEGADEPAEDSNTAVQGANFMITEPSSDEIGSQPESVMPEPSIARKRGVQSGLLSTLSPEAFRRVSMALEEVIGAMSPTSLPHFGAEANQHGIPAGPDEDDFEIDAVSGDEESYEDGSSTDHGSFDQQDNLRGQGNEPAVIDKGADDGASKASRRRDRSTPDSDTTSFRSAREDAAASVLHGGALAEREDDVDEETEGWDVDATPRLLQSESSQTVNGQRSAPVTGEAVMSGATRDVSAESKRSAGSALRGSGATDGPSFLDGFNSRQTGSSTDHGTNDFARSTTAALGTEGSTGSPSSWTPVLSAGAIAARNQRYFPNASTSPAATVPSQYASGFKSSNANTPISAQPSPLPIRQEIPSAVTPSTSAASSALARVTQAGDAPSFRNGRSDMRIEPAPRVSEDILSPTTHGLFPQPPKHDPALAERWRQTYGSGVSGPGGFGATSDTASIAAASDSNLSEFERQFEQDTDADDVWAKVAQNLEGQEMLNDDATDGRRPSGNYYRSRNNPNGDSAAAALSAAFQPSNRPTSHLPPAEAASQFADSGFTVDSLRAMQENLVRSASQRGNLAQEFQEPVNSTFAQDTSQSVSGCTTLSPKRSMSPTSFAKVEQARARARMIAERNRSPQGSISSSPRKPHFAEQRPHQRNFSDVSISDSAGRGPSLFGAQRTMSPTPSGGQPRPSLSGIPKSGSFKSQVMYDVTSSHRPTSPPPRRTSGVSSTLPSLLDLNSMGGFQPIPPVIDSDPHTQSSLAQAVDATADAYSTRGVVIDGPDPTEEYGGLFGEAIAEEDGADLSQSQDTWIHPMSGDDSTASQTGPGANTYDGLSHSQSYNALGGLRAPATDKSPASIQTSWSDPNSGASNGRRFGPNLVDDVANQAHTATVALKGPHTGDKGPHITPRKSRTLAKRKARKNPGKYIGVPELVSTSQQLGHAQPLPDPILRSPQSQSDMQQKRRPPVRQASDYKNDPKTMPATLLHRRASSSFGHTGQLDDGPSSPRLQAQQQQQSFTPGMAMYRAPSPQNGHSRVTTPGTPMSGKSTEPRSPSGGSLGRFMSRMRMRKSPGPEDSTSIGSYPSTPVPTSAPDGYNERLASGATSVGGGAAVADGNMTSASATPMRGVSPFALNGFNTQPDTTLPESGATRLAVAAPSPNPEGSRNSDGRWSNVIRQSDGNGLDKGKGIDLEQGDGFGGIVPSSWATNPSQISQGAARPADVERSTSPSAVSQSVAQGSQMAQSLSGSLSPQHGNVPSAAPEARGNTREKEAGDSSSSKDENKRKSARDTVVRRTLIFPNEASAAWASINEERRRSGVSTAASMTSRRKSAASMARRLNASNDPGEADEANSSYAALLAAAAAGGNDGRPSMDDGSALLPPRSSRFGAASLRPPSLGGYSTRRGSAAVDGASYAGSLYDMYIDDGASEDGSLRSSFYPPAGATGNHIEVTERADGSIVWQVIAGLGRRNAEDSANANGDNRGSTVGRVSAHSRVNSDASQFSFLNRPPRDSFDVPGNGQTPSIRGAERTFTGMLKKDEDSRSLFAKRRPDPTSDLPPLPAQDDVNSLTLPLLAPFKPNQRLSTREESIELPRPSSDLAVQQQLAFDMATPGASGTTRVVYSNDVELEQLLESLANQNDAAMFHFDPKQYYAQVEAARMATGTASSNGSGASALRPVSKVYRDQRTSMASGDGSRGERLLSRPASTHSQRLSKSSTGTKSLAKSLDSPAKGAVPLPAIDFDAKDGSILNPSENVVDPRRRVEDEIMTLLSRVGVSEAGAGEPIPVGSKADPLGGAGTTGQDVSHSPAAQAQNGAPFDSRGERISGGADTEALRGVSFDMLDSAARPVSGQSQDNSRSS